MSEVAITGIKVSVIVPTFRSGDGLTRVIDSLDAQTLPADEFEVIFVDDGSGDDTPARLHALAATRPNVRVIETENSGWGSRPRNIGVAAATGRYVTFMDHDDSLFPDALRSAYEAGARIDADFVNPKEISTRGWSWGFDVWREDRYLTDRAEMVPKDVTPLIPHKLYKRSFLDEHEIRFPEGPRAFWEDFYVNTEVFVHAKSIVILSSAPFYKWHRDTGANSSDKIYENVAEYWQKLEEVARFMHESVPELEARRWLVINHYRWWVVDLYGPHMSRRERSFIEESWPYVAEAFASWIPTDADADLAPAVAVTAHLLRTSDLDHVVAMAELDKGRQAKATVSSANWTADGLRIEAETTWSDGDGNPLLVRRDGERIVRDLPADLAAQFPLDVIDVRASIDDAWGSLSLRSRDDRITWPVPTEYEITLDDRGDDRYSVRVSMTALVDPSTGALGSPLENGIWEVGARLNFMGVEVHAGLRYADASLAVVHEGRGTVAYSTGGGILAMDVGAARRPLVAAARLDTASARFDRATRELHVPLLSTAQFGDIELSSTLGAARLVDSTLVVSVPSARGTYDWRLIAHGVESKPLPPIKVGALGTVSFVKAKA